MKMTTTTKILLIAAINLQLFEQVSSSCFSITTGSDASCSDNVFSGSSLSTSCDESDSSMTVSGTITVNNEFDSGSHVYGVPCIMGGMMCYPEYAQDLGEFCNLASGSSSCGEIGTYTVSTTQGIPAEAQGYSGYFSVATVKLFLNYDAACASGNGGNGGYFMMGVAAVPAVGIVALFMYRRRRRRPLIVLNEDDSNHDFVEMNDVQQMEGAMT